MKILVLGATGYLGTNIVKDLAEKGCQIVCVVRVSSNTGRLTGENIRFISNNKEEIEVLFKHEKIDIIINAVCTYKANDQLYEAILESNIIFPLSVINLAVRYGVKKFISLSTSLPEELNIYSFTKSKLSEFGHFFSMKDGIDYMDLKLEMFYGGEYEPSDRFIPSCVEKMINAEELLLTRGYQKRDIIRVEDVVGIVRQLIFNTTFFEGYKSLPVGVGESHSIREIMDYLKMILNSDSQIEYGAIETRVGEPNTLADIEWYKELGYELQYSYFDGLYDECKRRKSNLD